MGTPFTMLHICRDTGHGDHVHHLHILLCKLCTLIGQVSGPAADVSGDGDEQVLPVLMEVIRQWAVLKDNRDHSLNS